MSGSAQIFADFIVNQNNGSSTLKGEFIVQHPASSTLNAEFTVRHAGSSILGAEFIVQHPASSIVFSKFIVRQTGTSTLKGEFIVMHTGVPQQLKGKFKVAVHFSGKPQNLFAKFFRGTDASGDLKGVFNVTQDIDLKAKAVIRHSNTRDLFADFKVKIFFVEGWEDLKAEFVVRHSASSNLLAETVIRNKGSAELLGASVIRHSASTTLKSIFIVRHSSSTALKAKAIIRHSASRGLEARFMPRRSASRGLFAEFEPIPNRDLKAEAVIRHSMTMTLHARFFVRHPYRLWTTRRYVNGVVEAAEKMVGDASLEFIIEGVMDDIKTFLLANQMQTYVDWHTIEDVPITIRRACTYGTVASLYSRYTKTFSSRVIPTVAPVSVTVKGDDREAMEFWENKYDLMLQRYLDQMLTGTIFSTTSDEEPVFSMDDIPEALSLKTQTWHEWYRQREEG